MRARVSAVDIIEERVARSLSEGSERDLSRTLQVLSVQ